MKGKVVISLKTQKRDFKKIEKIYSFFGAFLSSAGMQLKMEPERLNENKSEDLKCLSNNLDFNSFAPPGVK